MPAKVSMPYLIDGHNLIPFIPGLSLADLDDELALIELIKRFASRQRSEVELYFDQAPPSQAGTRFFGRVKAHFVRQGITADQAIITRLGKLGGSARNWTVVSSDRVILAEAKSAHSRTMASPEFAALLADLPAEGGSPAGKDQDPEVSQGDVDYWLDQFKGS